MDTDVLERADLDVVETTEKGPECEVKGVKHPCTITAVAMGHPTCGNFPVVMVCQWIVNYRNHAVKIGGLCGDCGRLVAVCWQLLPI